MMVRMTATTLLGISVDLLGSLDDETLTMR